MAPEKYAVFFPEQDGYLFCGSLGAGAEGVTSIVRSIVNNQDYVRKKTKATSATSSHKAGLYCAEVSLYRPHPRIPTLVHSQDFQVLPQGHPRAEEFRATSMLFSYCNGGTLERFIRVLERERILAPEVLVWHLLDNLLEAIEHLHCNASISHGDLKESNIYLHFPTPESRLPDFYIGDLGLARPIDQSVWEVPGNPPARKLRDVKVVKEEDEQAQREYQTRRQMDVAQEQPPPPSRTQQIEAMINDLRGIHTCLSKVLEGRGQPDQNKTFAPFRDWNCVLNIMNTNPEDYNAFVGFRQAVRVLAQHARDTTGGSLPEFQWTRLHRYRDDLAPGMLTPSYSWKRYNHHLANHPWLKSRLPTEWQHKPLPEIQLYKSRYELLSLCAKVPGPWKIARVDPTTLRVLAVEELSFSLHVPSIKDNCPLTPSGRAFNHDDHPMVNQLVTTEVDRLGMANIVSAAMGSGHAYNQVRFWDVDPEWNGERLSTQGQLTLRATYLPPPEPPLPAPEMPPPAPQAGPSAPQRTSPTSSREALATEEASTAAQSPPETQQAATALYPDSPAAQQTSPSPPPPLPPQSQTPLAAEDDSSAPQQGSPVAQQNSPTPRPQTPLVAEPAAAEAAAAPEADAQEEEQANRVVKKTKKGGRKGQKGRARGAAGGGGGGGGARNPPARNHPATRPTRAAQTAPPSRVTTRSMARKAAEEKIIWTRSRTRAAAAAAQRR
ncbi:serine/threonine protein kinase [Cladophialophora psammophila CBS 110553]|uniref:non-specific serine/threonine protein kinase n=1 Tax=Cladophialophora psammophila CBS 110553 TaxID=1182543 RepID=W9WE90_9EURO|nr:serine/threonine protein kinase [Cladophialophora psammophila CBS 110553]EXJ66422.1 serine/threonine protein kinase [Cladophialophora psammophila CBS 110553]